jgi:hypothetical protein
MDAASADPQRIVTGPWEAVDTRPVIGVRDGSGSGQRQPRTAIKTDPTR